MNDMVWHCRPIVGNRVSVSRADQHARKLRYLVSAVFCSLPMIAIALLAMSLRHLADWLAIALIAIALSPYLLADLIGLNAALPSTLVAPVYLLLYLLPTTACLILYQRSGRRVSKWYALQGRTGRTRN